MARRGDGPVTGVAGAALGAVLGLSLSGGGVAAMLVGLVAGYVVGEWIDGLSAGPGRRRGRRGSARALDVVVGLLALALGAAALVGYARAARWVVVAGGVALLLVGARLLLRRV